MRLTGRSVQSLISRANHALERGDINTALKIAYNFVEQVITNPICTSQVFGSKELDDLCLRIGRQQLGLLARGQDLQSECAFREETVVYLVSRLQRSGGHSRLVQDFIRAQPEKNHVILSTEVCGLSDAKYFSELYASEGRVRFIRAPGGDLQERLVWLQASLLSIQAKHAFLFNHHQDSVAVAALVPEIPIEGSFCHHGDHHLCLGVHLNHLNHIDFHPMGFHQCRDVLGIRNEYLPLTFKDKSACEESGYRGSKTTGLTTATAARYNKIEVPYHLSYLDLIPEVLATTKGRHLHIGKLSAWGLRRLRSNLSRRGIASDRLIYIEWSPSVWECLQSHNVDVYIASFPYGAGLTLIEAMGAGIPVILHKHSYSRILSCLELAYTEAFSWSDPHELINHLSILTHERIRKEGDLARQRYEKYHRPEILTHCLTFQKSIQPVTPEVRVEFEPRYDEWASWVNLHLSWQNILYVKGFRLLRRLRTLYTTIPRRYLDIPRARNRGF